VRPGTYNELVTINKQVTLLGNRAGVDACDRRDGFGIGDAFRALDHRDHEDLRIEGGLRLGIPRCFVSEQRRRSAPTPRPQRRVAEGCRDAPGLIDRIDMRHDDAGRTVVERAGAFIDRVGANPDDRGDAGRYRGDADLRHVTLRQRAVLGVDEQPVVPGRGSDHARRRGAQMMHAESKGKAARAQFPDRGVLDKRHVFSPC